MEVIKSGSIWFGVLIIILLFFPLIAITRLLERDPAHYHTGRLFRVMGKLFSQINPKWKITITGNRSINDRNPYVMVCNHQSFADIPLICNLPWEMKWVAKEELFRVPVAGWMMRMAGDIPVIREVKNQKELIFDRAKYYLNNSCSVIFFPEGTRSRSGELRKFTHGAFELAIKEKVPVLPMVIDGTQNTLPRGTWKFGRAENIQLKILEPVDTTRLTGDDVGKLTDKVRTIIEDQLEEWRDEGRRETADGRHGTTKDKR